MINHKGLVLALLLFVTFQSVQSQQVYPQIANCITQEMNYCKQCKDGYFVPLQDRTMCLRCDSSCATCTDTSTTCTKCAQKYYTTSSSTGKIACKPCMTGCKMCNSKEICEVCETSGYFTLNGVCLNCLANCESCKDAATCDRCYATYEMANENGATVCKATWATIVVWTFVGLFICLLIPCIICCVCWEGVRKCLSLGNTHNSSNTGGYDSFSYNNQQYHDQPPNNYNR